MLAHIANLEAEILKLRKLATGANPDFRGQLHKLAYEMEKHVGELRSCAIETKAPVGRATL